MLFYLAFFKSNLPQLNRIDTESLCNFFYFLFYFLLNLHLFYLVNFCSRNGALEVALLQFLCVCVFVCGNVCLVNTILDVLNWDSINNFKKLESASVDTICENDPNIDLIFFRLNTLLAWLYLLACYPCHFCWHAWTFFGYDL